jgi:hypothetical protein
MEDFAMPLVGGLVLGAASSLLLVLNGRILGVSGVLGGALLGSGEKDWRWGFIAGILAAGAVLFFLLPDRFDNTLGNLCWRGNAARVGLHVGPWHLRDRSGLASLDGRHGHLHRRGGLGCGADS